MDDAGQGRRGLRATPSPALLAALRDHYGLVLAAGNADLGGSSNLNLSVTHGDECFVAHARAAHASGSARVFVTTLQDGETVVGYYALAAAQIAPEDATASDHRESAGAHGIHDPL